MPTKPNTTISNCHYYGVKWDAAATAAVQTLADALRADALAAQTRADAACRLAEVFKASNVHIEAMVRIGGKE